MREKEQVGVDCSCGERHVVPCDRIGPFAVHRSWSHGEEFRKGWTLTHHTTGRAIVRFVLRKQDAVTFARQLQKFDWADVTPKTSAAHPAKSLVERFRKSRKINRALWMLCVGSGIAFDPSSTGGAA